MCRLFFKIDLLSEFAALCLFNRFYRLEIHSLIGWKDWKNDYQKKFIPHLAIDTKFFHRTFANLCTIKK
jgi:hypothetical protein